MRVKFLSVIFGALATFTLPLSHAQIISAPLTTKLTVAQKKETAQVAINLFSNLCIKNMSSMVGVRKQLEGQPSLPKELSNFLLNDMDATIWRVNTPPEQGAHMFALADDVYYCAVLTLETDPQEVEQKFSVLAEAAPTGSQYTLIKNERNSTAENGQMHTKIYALTSDTKSLIITFTLKTYTAPSKGVPQSTLSISLERI